MYRLANASGRTYHELGDRAALGVTGMNEAA
jgi:hypothetical protein